MSGTASTGTTGGTAAPGQGTGGTAAPGQGTGAAPAPGQQPGGQQPGGEAQRPLSVREAAKQLGERRRPGRQAAGQRQGADANGAAGPARTVAATNGAAGGSSIAGSSSTAGASAAPAAGGDPLDRLMESFRPPSPAGGASVAGGAAAAPAAGADAGADAPIALTIGGQAQSFTRAQLAEHVEKGLDYTRKAQNLAKFAGEVQQAQAVIAEIAPLLIPEMEKQLRALEGSLGDEPDWVALAAADPAKYNLTRAQWDNAQRERAKLQRLQSQQQQQTDAQRQTQLTEGHKILAEKLPGWSDPQMRGRIQSEMIKWGRGNGFTDAELRNLYDPRQVLTLCKAMMLDRMLSGARTDAPVVPTVQRGSLPAPTPQDVQTNEAAFEARPSARNAAALLTARRRSARPNGAAG